MKQYLDLLKHVRDHGVYRDDRTGTGTYSVFSYQMRFDLNKGFPLVTTKKCHLKSIIHELIWFLKGDTNIKYLVENGVHIWTDWPLEVYNKSVHHGLPPVTREEFEKELLSDPEFAETFGDLGPVYGYLWRSWPVGTERLTVIDGKPVLVSDGIDQITKLIDQIKTNPDSRRLIVSAWNPALIDEMALPPCHCLFQFYVANGRLSCQLYQRSADIFLGVPFNIASYALLTMMIAQVCGLNLGEFIWTGGDCHLYANHIEQADLQLTREPLPLPEMLLNKDVTDIFDFKIEDFELANYQHHPTIKAPVAV